MVSFCAKPTCTNLAEGGQRYCSNHIVKLSVTEKQQRVLEFIDTFLAANQYPPSIREIGDGLSIKSTSTVVYYLDRLEMAGVIERAPGVARGLKRVKTGREEQA